MLYAHRVCGIKARLLVLISLRTMRSFASPGDHAWHLLDVVAVGETELLLQPVLLKNAADVR